MGCPGLGAGFGIMILLIRQGAALQIFGPEDLYFCLHGGSNTGVRRDKGDCKRDCLFETASFSLYTPISNLCIVIYFQHCFSQGGGYTILRKFQ